MRTRKKIVVAGTGNLAKRICGFLQMNGADIHVLTRQQKNQAEFKFLDHVTVHEVDYRNLNNLVHACQGAHCIVSALSGLREVIVDAQTNLVEAALKSNVERFIPSDFCIDYRKLTQGQNRNLDLRREFSTIIDSSGLKPTSILNGMFSDLLLNEAPVILKKQKRIFFWGNADQKMDFTSIDNTAEFTAAAALDTSSPRWLCISGEQASMLDIKVIASKVYNAEFKFLRPGGLQAFQLLIKVTKTFAPGTHEVFPAWQGMQYLHDMLTGLPKHSHLENSRYSSIKWENLDSILKSNL